MLKMYKILFTTSLFAGTLISISSYSWFGMWLGLEINLLSIIPLMKTKNMLSAEASVKYFMVQAIASTVIMISVIFLINKTKLLSTTQMQSSFMLMMNSALLTKMGATPFHFWFPEVLEGLDWINCLLILTWQKIAPMVLLMYNVSFNLFMTVIILASVAIGGVMGINQISMRKILAYSSINHMGWMLGAMMVTETIWMLYLLVYSLITTNLVLIFDKMKIFFVNQIHNSMNEYAPMKMWFMMNFLSMSGIPPFLGFLPKWLTIQALVMNSMIMLPVTMIMLTLVTMFMYMRITVSTMLLNMSEMNWMKIDYSIKKLTLVMINFMSISSLMLITIAFNLS